ncbi:hypothetical protein TNCV_2171401 [Trichonephila clavipes]|nr:hypothetical protein TNCV_2171401 [Trichonephila clavipes]
MGHFGKFLGEKKGIGFGHRIVGKLGVQCQSVGFKDDLQFKKKVTGISQKRRPDLDFWKIFELNGHFCEKLLALVTESTVSKCPASKRWFKMIFNLKTVTEFPVKTDRPDLDFGKIELNGHFLSLR